MRAPRTMLLAAALALVVAGCGSNNEDEIVGPQSEGQSSEQDSGSDEESTGNPDDLVALEDDEGLQRVDNIVPVVQAEAAGSEQLVEALNRVSEALTPDELIAMNRAADLERQTPPNVAQAFVEENGLAEGVDGGTGSLVIGAANFSESQILANVYSLALEGAGFDTEIRSVTNREVYGPALQRGELTVFPEYVGTFTEYLNTAQNGPDAEPVASNDLDSTMEGLRELAGQVGLEVLEPAEADNRNAFAVTREFAEENDLRTLSDLAGFEGDLVLGGPPECPTRPFCQAGLEETYGIEFDGFVSLDAGGPLTKTALQQGRIQVGLVFSSDGSLSSLDS